MIVLDRSPSIPDSSRWLDWDREPSDQENEMSRIKRTKDPNQAQAIDTHGYQAAARWILSHSFTNAPWRSWPHLCIIVTSSATCNTLKFLEKVFKSSFLCFCCFFVVSLVLACDVITWSVRSFFLRRRDWWRHGDVHTVRRHKKCLFLTENWNLIDVQWIDVETNLIN